MGTHRDIARIDEIAGYVSVPRAAAILEVNEGRVRQLVIADTLKAVRWGGMSLMITRASVDAYLESTRQPGYWRRGPAKGSGGRPKNPKRATSEATSEEPTTP